MAISMVFLAALGIGLVTAPSARAAGYATTLLHSFTGSGDGIEPQYGSLIMDVNGNLYGTTGGGGAHGSGTVFELVNSAGTYSEKVLYSFGSSGSSDGSNPAAGLVMDASGNLYGTTFSGGASCCGYGTVFELVNSSGTYSESVLYSFGYPDGANPYAGLVRDASGNLYGTTYNGGASGYGTVFELVNSSGTYSETVLHSFTNTDGSNPYAGLVRDASGNLYGTTYNGGAYNGGTVFELVNSSGTYSETVLHAFAFTSTDGQNPIGGLVRDASGNLYGTTQYSFDGVYNGGIVFELVNSSGTYSETVLHSFTGPDGASSEAGLIMDASGNLYGTTSSGGSQNGGTVFELVKSSGTYSEKVLHGFTSNCGLDGGDPHSGLVMDASGNLFGTTYGGGSGTFGTVFEVVSFTGQATGTTTSLTSSLNPATAGNGLALTASVAANSSSRFILSGTMTISNGSIVLGTSTVACGSSTQVTVEDAETLGVGVDTITAQFTPDTAAFAPSSVTLGQTVNEPGVAVTGGNNTFTGNQTVNGTVNATSIVGGSVAIGGGTPITEYISITKGITLPALDPQSCTNFTTAAVTGFTPGASDTIALGTPSALLTGLGDDVFLVYQAWETTTTASPTVTIKVCNPSGSRYRGGASGTLRVSIFKQ